MNLKSDREVCYTALGLMCPICQEDANYPYVMTPDFTLPPMPGLPMIEQHQPCKAACRRGTGVHQLLEAKINALHRVASAAREVIGAAYASGTPYTDEEFAALQSLIDALKAIPTPADA